MCSSDINTGSSVLFFYSLFPFHCPLLVLKVISDELKKTCQTLTSHSLRRGAVQHLVGRDVDLEMIRQLTRRA